MDLIWRIVGLESEKLLQVIFEIYHLNWMQDFDHSQLEDHKMIYSREN